jgi:hypothetical protein
MENFQTEFEVGEIFRRDKWQFELKSEFFPSPKLSKNIYKQEFYFFIPNALQINNNSYTMKQFYHDQTNLIRYKTPTFTIKDLLDPNNPLSPLVKIKKACDEPKNVGTIDIIEDELKLLGNIIRSLLRKRVGEILRKVGKGNKDIYSDIHSLCTDIERLRTAYSSLEIHINQLNGNSPLQSHYYYTEEFVNSAISFYLTGLLEKVRDSKINRYIEINDELEKLIIKEMEYSDITIAKTQSKA